MREKKCIHNDRILCESYVNNEGMKEGNVRVGSKCDSLKNFRRFDKKKKHAKFSFEMISKQLHSINEKTQAK